MKEHKKTLININLFIFSFYSIGHAELKLIVCSKENLSKVMESAAKCPKLKYVIQMVIILFILLILCF